MLLVMAPSRAFSVDTVGWPAPCGHSVRYPNDPDGTTVAFSTYPCAAFVPPHPLPITFTSSEPVNGGDPLGFLVSSTRHGGRLYKDSPPAPAGAKYPLMSTTRSVVSVTYTSMLPAVPAGTIAALATIVPVRSFSVDTKGWLCPVGQTVK